MGDLFQVTRNFTPADAWVGSVARRRIVPIRKILGQAMQTKVSCPPMTAKELAGHAALRFVENDMLVGLGTGSTATEFIKALGEAMRTGKLKGVRGIPTSK